MKSEEEIQQYFRSTQLNKPQKLKERADKLDIRVRELVTKKEKYQAIEKEGKKLLETWKSIARLEEEEQKEVDRLQKIKEDIMGARGFVLVFLFIHRYSHSALCTSRLWRHTIFPFPVCRPSPKVGLSGSNPFTKIM